MKGRIFMKVIRAVIKTLFFTLFIGCSAIFVMMYFASQNVSDSYKINHGDTLHIESEIPVTAHFSGEKMSQSSGDGIGESFTVDLKMFGIIPFSTATVEVVDEMYVSVLGTPFGMKVYTEGVLVIELSDVDSAEGNVNPAEKAGIKAGDYIQTVNGKKITCNEDLSELVAASKGQPLKFTVKRGDKSFSCKVTPVISLESGSYRVGIWVRDSSAGIGTLTFYSPSNGIVCGLGHGICDSDTGTLLSPCSGELVGAQIVSVEKGSSGSPGELKGKFTFDTIAGLCLNSESGVYGYLKGSINAENLTEIALKQEIYDGPAQILCTVNGSTPKLYSCTVKKRSSTYLSRTQNLIVTVTDKELISETGGIVQGMSGSPILQDGKLIGALTHVLVDDSTSGYGIFAENMLETAQGVANEQLKDAS